MIVDMHCHVLPGIDDGSESMEETLAVLREAERQGITHMIMTPHHHPGRYLVDAQVTRECFEEVQRHKRRFHIKLFLGQECYYYSDLVHQLDTGKALTMAGSSYVLIEFSPSEHYSMLCRAVGELTNGGYIPILAHIERYGCLYNRRDLLDELHGLGACLQMNFDRLLDRDTFFHRNPWRQLVKEGYIDYMGSDTHGTHFRPLHVEFAVDWMYNEVDPELRQQILIGNIKRILGKLP